MAANLTYLTSIRSEGGRTIVRYHSTDIVAFDPATITLRSGGYETRTTKSKMNKASEVYGLGY
jgi:hypothetical protein